MANPIITSTPEQAQLLAILGGPVATPPTGIKPNLVDPPTLTMSLILNLTFCVTFFTLAVLARLYTKKVVIRAIAYEVCRWLILRCIIITLLMCIRRAHYGMGTLRLSASCRSLMTPQDSLDCTRRHVLPCHQSWWRGPCLEHTNEDSFRFSRGNHAQILVTIKPC